MMYDDIPKEMMKDVERLSTYMLFGSRSMAARPAVEGFNPVFVIGSQITERTDYDFSAPYSAENHDILIDNGFTHFGPDLLSYKDQLTTGVYVKTYSPKFIPGNLIASFREFGTDPVANVVLRSDYNLFRQTWNSITPQFYCKYIWKRSHLYDEWDYADKKTQIADIMDQLFVTSRGMI